MLKMIYRIVTSGSSACVVCGVCMIPLLCFRKGYHNIIWQGVCYLATGILTSGLPHRNNSCDRSFLQAIAYTC